MSCQLEFYWLYKYLAVVGYLSASMHQSFMYVLAGIEEGATMRIRKESVQGHGANILACSQLLLPCSVFCQGAIAISVHPVLCTECHAQ